MILQHLINSLRVFANLFVLITLFLLTTLLAHAEQKATNPVLPFSGKYIIEKDIPLPGISGLSQEEVDAIVGKVIEFSDEKMVYHDKPHEILSVQIEDKTNAEFMQSTGGSSQPPKSFEDLGYTGQQKYMHEYKLTFRDDYWGIGTFIDYFDDSCIRLYYEGVWFVLKKNN